MLFYLKKIISMFLMPLPLGIIILLLGVYFLYRKSMNKAKFFLITGVVWLFIFSYPPLTNAMLNKVESQYPTLTETPTNTQYIYVLGGGHVTDSTLPISSQVYADSVIRLNEGIRHYQNLHGKVTLIVSGYGGLTDPTPHAVMQEKLAQSLGINIKNLIVLSDPKDTEEEAKAAEVVIRNAPFILVTSASHMARAIEWFRKEGLHPIPSPANHKSSLSNPAYFSILSSHALTQSRIVFYEMLGQAWQWIKS